jgi:TonB family protein
LAAGIGGMVLVAVDVQPDGRVTNVSLAPRQPVGVTRVHALLGEAAMGAARQFLFEPRPLPFEQFHILFQFDLATGTTSTLPTPPPPPPPPPTQRAIRQVDAEYPPEARTRNITGMVRLNVSLAPTGQVVDAAPLEGPLLLVPAAVAAVRQWQWAPSASAVAGAELYFFVDEHGEYVGRPEPPAGYRAPDRPRLEHIVQPELPPGFTGAHPGAFVRVTIAQDGSVTDVLYLPDGDPLLRADAIAAARAARYSAPYVAPYVLTQLIMFTVPK